MNKYKILYDALQEIKEKYGRVCNEFELCTHVAWQSSVASWMVADKALRTVDEVKEMSQILKTMQSDLKESMKMEIKYKKEGTTEGILFDSVIAVKYVVRSVLSMFPDIDVKPDNATDEITIQLLKKFIFKEKTSELYNQKIFTQEIVSKLSPKELTALTKEKIAELGEELTSLNIGIAQTYLPKEATVDEIKEWIIENIDFSVYKNKMQAMKIIMDQFKGVDGNVVKNLIMSM